jgi:hypothetical protein
MHTVASVLCIQACNAPSTASAALLLTSLRSRFIRRGLLLDMLAGVARNESSSMASTLHVAVGEAAGDASTATGEEGPILALADMCVCTALSGRLLSQVVLTAMC